MPRSREPVPEYDVEEVEVEAVRPLRLRYLRPGQPDDSVVYESDDYETAQHFAVRGADGAIVGVGTVYAENRVAGRGPHRVPGYRIRGMAVETAARGQGIGRAILQRLIQVARDAEAEEAWANARVDAIGIYQKTGFVRLSKEFEIPQIGAHVVMAMPLLTRKERKAKQAAEAAEAAEGAAEDAAAGDEPDVNERA